MPQSKTKACLLGVWLLVCTSSMAMGQSDTRSPKAKQQSVRPDSIADTGSYAGSDTGTADALYTSPGKALRIATKDITLRDAKQKKDLQIRATFPKTAGLYPLIIFSHGMFGSAKGYRPLVESWASHGYVVLQATHGDSLSLLSKEERKKLKSMRDLRKLMNSVETKKHYRTRPKDVVFMLDSLDTIEKKVPALRGKIDRKRIGMAGHSFGANTTLLLAGMGARNPFRSKPESFVEKRFRAFIAISPPGPGRKVTQEYYKTIRCPVMVITGTNDKSPVSGKGPDWRKESYTNLPQGDKYFVFLEGADHSFGGINGGKGFFKKKNASHVAYVQAATLAYWNAYLKEDAAAKKFLVEDALKEKSSGAVTTTHK